MSATPLTTKFLDSLKARPDRKRYSIADGGLRNFEIRVGPDGMRTFCFRYRFGNEQRRVSLGKYPKTSLAVARDRARAIVQALEKGEDPKPMPLPVPQTYTLQTVAERFFDEYLKMRGRRSADEIERELRADLLQPLGQRSIKSIQRRDIRDLLEMVLKRAREGAAKRVLDKAVAAEHQKAKQESRTTDLEAAKAAAASEAERASQGAGYVANRLLAYTRKLFNWALEQDYVEQNPCAGLHGPKEEIARDRILSDDEIRAVWLASDDLGVIGEVTKVLFLTGARLGEVAGMRWSELDEANGIWRLPRERTKNNREHTLPLAQMAKTIIFDRPRISGCDYVFSTTGRSPVSGFSKFKRSIDSRCGFSTLWRLHDIRRTVASGMASLGTAPYIIEAVLNHASGTVSGVAAVYNRYQYASEKGAALEQWAERLRSIVDNNGFITWRAAV